MVKKINATENFNAGAIIATPKRQLLAQKHVIWRIGHFFAQLTLFAQPYNPMPYNAFQSARHRQKCPFPWGHLHSHVMHDPWTHPT